ncbi:MAG: pilus assembly protein TadG-related protein [Candidatus Baltobacteraceae bacterium]
MRGQTMPVWAFGTLTVLVLFVFALSYGSMLRWQIRAQNAADAAARGLLSVQATQWNEMESDLQAAAVEEYRIRTIAQSTLLTIHGDGGCNSLAFSGPTSCEVMYENLRSQYLDAVARYTSDITVLHRITGPTFDDQANAMKASLALLQQNCSLNNGGDCAFDYTLVAAQPRVDQYMEDVYADCCSFAVGGGTVAPAGLTKNFTPMEIEVVACANVQAPVPSFFTFKAPTYVAIGRAAATTIMATQEFMYPGTIVNPRTNQPFQPVEYPESATNAPVLGANNDFWYKTDFGGNPATTDGQSMFWYQLVNDGLLTAVGWWSSIAITPFSGTLAPGASFQCK